MAASLNKVLLIGNLGANPELSYTPSGTAKATMRLATNEVWKTKDGEKGSRTEWHRLIAWGRLAEVCGEYLVSGRQIFVEGRTQTRSWEDDDGVRRFITEVILTNMQMLGNGTQPAEEVETPEEEDEELPF